MTLTTTTIDTACQTRLGFEIEMLITDGWLPVNIGVELGVDAIRKHYQAIRFRGYFQAENWLLAILSEATAIEKATPATIKVETITAPTVEVKIETADAEIVAALTKFALTEPLNAQIMQYLVNGYAVGCHHFCKSIGVHTATMAARVNQIDKLSKRGRNQPLKDRLIQLYKVEIKSYGGQSKVK